MPKVSFHKRFLSIYHKFSKRSQKRFLAIDRALRLFAHNPRHPSLHTEKLSGSNVWSIRIDQNNRLFFIWSDDNDTAIFFSVGPHDSYRAIKK